MLRALALTTLLGACAADRGAEISCQKWLVETPAASWAPEPNRFAASFRAVERRLGEPPEGCSEEQKERAQSLAKHAAGLAEVIDQAGNAVEANRAGPALASEPAFAHLMAELERYEHRRELDRRDLQRMQAENSAR